MKGFGLSDIEGSLVEEKSKDELSELPEEFYDKSANYVSELSREMEGSEDLRRELLETELERVLEMVQEIHLLRTLKILDSVGGGEGHLLPRERKAFENILGELEELREELVEPVVRGESGLEPPREAENVLISMTSEVPDPLVGADMGYYGPFEEREIANIPEKTARLLMDQGLAEKLEIMEC